MTVIELEQYRHHGNGGREAMVTVIAVDPEFADDAEDIADVLLARLWMLGFKLVPVEHDDAAEPPLYA
jgi:hypothetical protein